MDILKSKRRQVLQGVKSFFKSQKSTIFVPGTSRINYAGRVFDEKELVNLVDSCLDFWLTAGRFCAEFEKRFALLLDRRYCLLANSGSSANLLAISALTSPLLKNDRLKPSDEVITTACGFPTTLNPIVQNNLIPVFVDVELGTYNIKVEDIEKAISKKTKAIFIAHTLGNPANIDAIMRLVKKYHLWFIEDNCDSLGSKYGGKFTGTFGEISTASFYPAHHITMGEGGAVLTDESRLKKIIVSFRDWGRDCWCATGVDNTCRKRFTWKIPKMPSGYDHKYIYSHIGYNLKITDMQAAVGLAQLDKLPGFIKERKRNFKALFNIFQKYEKFFILPVFDKLSEPSWFGFPLLVKPNAPFLRGQIVNYLEKNNIATRMLFGGNLIRQPAYGKIKYRLAGNLSNTDLVMNNLFWLGVYPGISPAMIKYINNTVDNFFTKFIKVK